MSSSSAWWEQYAVIVTRALEDWMGRRWRAAVVQGTIHRYYPAPYRIRAWTAEGARRKGERRIRGILRMERDRRRRDAIARRATGYDDAPDRPDGSER